MRKGITIISLVITIVVVLIILSAIISSTVLITNNSKKTMFAKDLRDIEEAIIKEYNTNGVLPVVIGEENIYSVARIKTITSNVKKLD